MRLVRVPDATTYERQIAALRTLRNVPTSRTKPPSARIVRALFAAARCPPAGATSSDDDDEEIAGDLSPSKAFVAGHFAAAPDVAEAFGDAAKTNVKTPFRALGFDQLPPWTCAPRRKAGWSAPGGFRRRQALAVRAALCGGARVLDQGPPGTGKTKVVLEIIRRAVASGSRVLACAPSNAAVDNLVERLAEAERDGASVSFVRVGAPERISDAALESSLEARVRDATAGYFDQARSTRRRELVDATRRGWEKRDELRRSGGKTRGPGDAKLSRRRRALDAREALASARRAEKDGDFRPQDPPRLSARFWRTRTWSWPPRWARARRTFRNSRRSICWFWTKPHKPPSRRRGFRSCGARAPCWWATRGSSRRWSGRRRLGDAGSGRPSWPASLSRSRDERRREGAPKAQKRTTRPRLRFCPAACSGALRTQYRSHAAISDWASRETYGGALAASPSVATRLLRDLPGVVATAATTAPAPAAGHPRRVRIFAQRMRGGDGARPPPRLFPTTDESDKPATRRRRPLRFRRW